MSKKVVQELNKLSDPNRAEASRWFFKTGRGEYGEGDEFIGVTVPNQRKVARANRDLSIADVQQLLDSKVHEHRLTGLLILVAQYESSKLDESTKKKIVDFYVNNVKKGRVNNWDLVDLSSHKILGKSLLDEGDREILYEMAKSGSLWQERVSIISTFSFIADEQFGDALKIAELLLHHEHDLIQKAVGWMLREIGNRDRAVEEEFLGRYYMSMPRTMLRYAIEKFPETLRQDYLKGRV